MIKARGTYEGRQVLVVGLTFEDLDILRGEPGQTIQIQGADVGLGIDLLHITAGRDERELLCRFIGFTPDKAKH